MDKIQLDLPLLLPEMAEGDECTNLLTDWLLTVKGIEDAHIIRDNGIARLCLHFDPNLISLGRVQRLAEEAGIGVTDRYRHEQISVTSLPAADAADTLTGVLEKLPGMLHAYTNYAAGTVFVAYDSKDLPRPVIEQAIRHMGVKVVSPPAEPAREEKEVEEGKEEHDHGSAPSFLPHWMQERWTLILVGLAGLFFLTG
jgi:Cd2+/Zn2+-exporting ATPase